MPIISFVNPKGGSGKTTSALLLACEIAHGGGSVAIIDADPERWITSWAAISDESVPQGISIYSEVDQDNILNVIDRAEESSMYVIIDLEGTADMIVAYAVGKSDLVILPIQGSDLDARGASKAINLIKNVEKMGGDARTIDYTVIFTRTSAVIRPRSIKNIEGQLAEANIPYMSTQLLERDAFKALFSYGGGLRDLDPKEVPGIVKAIDNTRAYTEEVLDKLSASLVQA